MDYERTCEQGCNGCDECTDYEVDDMECERCHGDGMDPLSDYLLPCPLCQGEQQPVTPNAELCGERSESERAPG